MRLAAAALVGASRLRHPGTAAELAAARDARIRRLVEHAYARVPYYRRLFDAHGIRPAHVRRAADLAIIPPSTRDQLAAADPADLVASGTDADRLIPMRSSGSSGLPFTTRRTWLEQNVLHLYRVRAHWLLGWRPGWRSARIRYRYHVDARDSKLIGRMLHAAGIAPTAQLDMLLPAREIANRLREIRPDLITGYPATLALVASELDGDDRRAIGARLVMSGAERLSEEMRRHIGRRFGAPVCDTYGTSEFNLVAWECREAGGMHTCDDAVAVDVETPDGTPARPGESGEIIGTGLHSFAMPFIRYRVGDVVTRGAERCPCGLPFATLTAVQGRVVDYFPLPDGRVVHPYAITTDIVRPVAPWMRQHQIVQERSDNVVLRLVPAEPPPRGAPERVEAAVREFLGPAVEFRLELVSEIPRGPNGKVRLAESQVRAGRSSEVTA